jgi:hypothetical protein
MKNLLSDWTHYPPEYRNGLSFNACQPCVMQLGHGGPSRPMGNDPLR